MTINKKTMYLLLLVIASIFILSCKGSKNNATSSLTREGGEWVLKIDDTTVYEDQFNKEYEFALKMSGRPADQVALLKNNQGAKQEFLEGLISQVLILEDAEEKEFFETEEAKDYMDTAYRSLKVQYYTQKMMEESLKEIPEPTQQDIANFYNQFRNELMAEGVTELNAQTIPYLSQLIKGQQAQQKMMIIVTDLKDKSVVERNKEIIGETMIPGSQQQQMPPQVQVPPQGDAEALR